MQNGRFSRYWLRTTDVPAATAFYDAVLGQTGDQIFPLHEQALARGARPHWLGQIHVSEPTAAAAPFLAAGAQHLGAGPGGAAVLRDPGGALVALGTAGPPSRAGVVWHVLRARGVERLGALYAQAFGWSFGEPVAVSGETYRPLAWEAGGPSAGVAGELTDGVHAQWLHFFGVDALDEAVAKVRERGGLALGPSLLGETRYAVCDDPQGAAFGLTEARVT